MTVRIGIDIGGTFTDVVLSDPGSGLVEVHKLSTTRDLADGIAEGIASIMARAGTASKEVTWVAHGSTVATNAVIQRSWGTTGLLTTAGFRDVLEIRRQVRPDPDNLRVVKPRPVVPRQLRFEVSERVTASGDIETAVDPAQVRERLAELTGLGIDSIAICFLHSYLDRGNEARVADLVTRAHPDLYVSASADLIPEFREYPRVSTTVMNAALMPVVDKYLSEFGGRLSDQGVRVEPKILGSDGAIMSMASARQAPIRILNSGPSAGVIGACRAAEPAGVTDFITLDMGGTSTDVCLVAGGVASRTHEREVSGYPVKYESLDVLSIGAGGGSIAWVDDGGFLQVGPTSAGANPGPACYGRGGERPTVTDANVVLGRLSPIELLSGDMAIDRGPAERSIKRYVSDPLGISVEDGAIGILRVVNNNIVRAVRLISVERGYNPADLWLVAFGGAGPLHAIEVAKELGFSGVLVPRYPGLLCAAGLLAADVRNTFSTTAVLSGGDLVGATRKLAELAELAESWVKIEGAEGGPYTVTSAIDMRYKGQSFELTTPVGDGGAVTTEDVRQARREFDRLHNRTYGYAADRDVAIELVTFRVTASIPVDKLSFEQEPGGHERADANTARRDVFFDEHGWTSRCPVADRSLLRVGASVEGPRVLEQLDSTCVIPPGVRASVDIAGNLHIPLA